MPYLKALMLMVSPFNFPNNFTQFSICCTNTLGLACGLFARTNSESESRVHDAWILIQFPNGYCEILTQGPYLIPALLLQE